MMQVGEVDLNIGQSYLSEWTEGMAIRELIANAIDETSDGKIDIKKVDENKWSIINKGKEIQPDNFVIKEGGKSNSKGKIGKFGIGLKDAIAVLSIRGVNIRIITSDYEYKPIFKRKSRLINEYSLFIRMYKNKRLWKGTEIILENCLDSYIENAKSYFLNYIGNYKVVDKTEYGEILLEENKYKNGTIYLNGIKIAYENTFLYSYNIKIEDDTLKKGISRERVNLGRDIYKESVKRIIKSAKSDDVLYKYYEKMIKSSDGTLRGELVYTVTQLRVIEYIIKHRINAVIFPTERSGRIGNLYNELSFNGRVKIIVLSNGYYKRLKDYEELIDSNIIADYYKSAFKEITFNDLDLRKKNSFKSIQKFVEENISHNLVSSISIVDDDMFMYNNKERKVIIPEKYLNCVKECCLNIINVIMDYGSLGNELKDEIIKKYIDREIVKI